MSKKNGNTLSLGQQANWHAAVLKALPRDITAQLAHDWEMNGEALTKVLRNALCPPPVAENSILRRLYPNETLLADGRIMEVYEVVKTASYAGLYGSFGADLENLWMTVRQREEFCGAHGDKFGRGVCHSLFLQKKDEAKPATPDNLIVAYVGVGSSGLYVCGHRFEYGVRVWRGESLPRLVLPATNSLKLRIS